MFFHLYTMASEKYITFGINSKPTSLFSTSKAYRCKSPVSKQITDVNFPLDDILLSDIFSIESTSPTIPNSSHNTCLIPYSMLLVSGIFFISIYSGNL